MMRKVWGIKRAVLKMILEASKSTHPNEFCAVLRYDRKKGVITEILPLPGSLFGERSATFQLHMLPIDYTIVGTVHSHPSPSFQPSMEDLYLFEKFGYVHIIVCYPFGEQDWCAYDLTGSKIDLKVV